MKTPSPSIRTLAGTLVACLLLALTHSVVAADSLPVGLWKVTFDNGVVETCEIRDDGSVTVVESARRAMGAATLKDGLVEIIYADHRAERWSRHGDQLRVRHWYPAVTMGKMPAVSGTAELIDQETAPLEVHEWGTFTVLQGSDGRVIEWYQAPDKLVDLPSFVSHPNRFMGNIRVSGKTGTRQQGGMDAIRMETPVLYFYPEKAMDVTVRASFPMGRITEVFPPAHKSTPAETEWRGSLLPPDSPELSKVPAATGPKGRHYAAARDVPDAWLFRNQIPRSGFPTSTTTAIDPVSLPFAFVDLLRLSMMEVASRTPAADSDEPKVSPIDHFIFYRGAGNRGHFELSAVQGEGPDTFTLTNRSVATVPKLFAIRVDEGQTSWLAIDKLQAADLFDLQERNSRTFSFPAPAGPTPEVAAGLRAAMIASLHAEGLTADEAAAMVATWDDLWFTEPGTRILAILPRVFADDMVPLTITPTPEKLERVFVARVELITRECEQKLTSLLNPPADAAPLDVDRAANQLTALELGRYTAGGMERATTIVNQKMRDRIYKLTQAADEKKKLQAGR